MKYQAYLLGATLLGFAASPAPAQDLTGTLKKIRETGAITLGYRESSVPFSYYNDQQQPVGYAIDLCMKIVDVIKTDLKMPRLQVKFTPETPATRIPLMTNGTIDLECGSTSNTLARQKQVAFSLTDFVTATRFVSKKADNLKTLDDLKGKTVVTTSGTTTIKLLNELNTTKKLELNIIPAKDHADSFLMVESGRASAFFMDDVLLASLAAGSRSPGSYVISADPLSVEPYGLMLRREDPAFKEVVDRTMRQVYQSGEIDRIYAKWFTSPVPPLGINMNLPMSAVFKKAVAHPTDSGDPDPY